MVWCYESRQSRRWIAAQEKEGKVSKGAARMLYRWTKSAKTPSEIEKIRKPWKTMSATDKHKEAWSTWMMLQEERVSAMAAVTEAICPDWWGNKGAREAGNEWMEDGGENELQGGGQAEEGEEESEEEDEEGSFWNPGSRLALLNTKNTIEKMGAHRGIKMAKRVLRQF